MKNSTDLKEPGSCRKLSTVNGLHWLSMWKWSQRRSGSAPTFRRGRPSLIRWKEPWRKLTHRKIPIIPNSIPTHRYRITPNDNSPSSLPPAEIMFASKISFFFRKIRPVLSAALTALKDYHYPLPSPEEIFKKLNGGKLFKNLPQWRVSSNSGGGRMF